MVRHKPTNCGVVAKCETEIWRVGNESAEDPASPESLGQRAAMKVASLAPAVSSRYFKIQKRGAWRDSLREKIRLSIFSPAGVCSSQSTARMRQERSTFKRCTLFRPQRHSRRKAVIGSTDKARRAGIKQARVATAIIRNDTPNAINGSCVSLST